MCTLEPSPEDKALYPCFKIRALDNAFKSNELGKPVSEDVEWLEIIIPGNKTQPPGHAVNDGCKKRFPAAYAAFKNTDKRTKIGTDLADWPPLTPAWVKTFKYHNIYSVEQLSAVSDSVLSEIGPGTREYREKAKAWLKVAEDGAFASKMTAENSKLKTEIDFLKEQLKELSDRLTDSLKEKKKNG